MNPQTSVDNKHGDVANMFWPEEQWTSDSSPESVRETETDCYETTGSFSMLWSHLLALCTCVHTYVHMRVYARVSGGEINKGRLTHTRAFLPAEMRTVIGTSLIHYSESWCLKGQFIPKSKIDIFPLTRRAIYQSRLFWCELPSFGNIIRRDFCLLSNTSVALNVVLTAPKIHFKNSSVMSLSRNHDHIK